MSRLEDAELQKSKLAAERVAIRNRIGHIDQLLASRSLYGKPKQDAVRRKDVMLSDIARIDQQIELLLPVIVAESRREAEASADMMADAANKMATAARDAQSASAQAMLVIQELNTLRARYMAFAEDTTRIASMRTMAAQFSNELTEMLDRMAKP